jgi:hypothetical protein
MTQSDKFAEVFRTYERHGWQLRRVLCSAETRIALAADAEQLFGGATIQEAALDALWFARPSHEGREAWELRLVAEPPYALFETFEADEVEEDREELRLEMEARMREYVTPK